LAGRLEQQAQEESGENGYHASNHPSYEQEYS
jgi:hypothetical protein